jgi:hypothetical protein
MLLISLAMLVVAGVIWGSFSAVSASAAAARTRKSAEQNVRATYIKGDVADSATPKDAPAAPVNETGVQNRNRAGDSEPAKQGNADESGERMRARDGSGFGNSSNYEAREERREQNRAKTESRVRDRSGREDCDGTCPNYETREERREQNRAKAESRVRDKSGREDCDGTCPNYETREERREQNRAKAESRVRDRSGREDCGGTCPNYETREERREQNRAGSDTGDGGRETQGRFQGDKRP